MEKYIKKQLKGPMQNWGDLNKIAMAKALGKSPVAKQILKPFKKKVHIGNEIWTYKIGVSHSVILTPKGDRKIIASHKEISTGQISHNPTKEIGLSKKSEYMITPGKIRQFIENNILKTSNMANKKVLSPLSRVMVKQAFKPVVNPKNKIEAPGIVTKKSKLWLIKVTEASPLVLETVKVLKENLGLGLKESKDLAETQVPYIIRNLQPAQAKKLHDELIKVGVKCSLHNI